ncbi:hypothetical protein ACFVT5_41475 [Streptomyces sp. NPDC058001]|uniref:hypothetical protein n=1 Tax=Streptomyces sp. NPDC058001 TaxID=3346300 RepID=UPI0036F156C0
MNVTTTTDLTDYYQQGWEITLEISARSAHLAWSPEGLVDPETFPIRVTRHPLTKKQINEIVKTVKTFEDLALITGANWTYLHSQSRWGWEADEDVEAALDSLRDRIEQIV